MRVRKAFRYRVYPTPGQLKRLDAWQDALRFLWNLAHDQRLMGLRSATRRYPTAFDQHKELTALRGEAPWLADVPRNVCAQLLVELDKAWQRCFKRIGRRPHFKRKGRDHLGFCEPHPKTWRIGGGRVRFPKLGWLKTVMHRPLQGTPKTCTLCRDGDQWFVSIVCELETDPRPRTEPVVAVDRGITHLLADSDGRLTPNPRPLERSLRRLAHAQRVVARRRKGSSNQKKARRRVMRLHRKVRRQRDHVLHVESTRLAKSHGVVVIEKLNVAGMIRGRLSRYIADAGWSRFAWMLGYKLLWSGGTLVEVPAHYSSQMCSECGCVDASSRKGERFCCTGCGHVDHADLNAAKVLKTRVNRSGLPVEGKGHRASRRSRKVGSVLRVPRRATPQSHVL